MRADHVNRTGTLKVTGGSIPFRSFLGKKGLRKVELAVSLHPVQLSVHSTVTHTLILFCFALSRFLIFFVRLLFSFFLFPGSFFVFVWFFLVVPFYLFIFLCFVERVAFYYRKLVFVFIYFKSTQNTYRKNRETPKEVYKNTSIFESTSVRLAGRRPATRVRNYLFRQIFNDIGFL